MGHNRINKVRTMEKDCEDKFCVVNWDISESELQVKSALMFVHPIFPGESPSIFLSLYIYPSFRYPWNHVPALVNLRVTVVHYPRRRKWRVTVAVAPDPAFFRAVNGRFRFSPLTAIFSDLPSIGYDLGCDLRIFGFCTGWVGRELNCLGPKRWIQQRLDSIFSL